jgi:hypothetical protein
MTVSRRFRSTMGAGALLSFLGLFGGCSNDGTGPEADPSDAVQSIDLNLDSIDVIIGDTVRLSAVPKDAKGQSIAGVKLIWKSTNPNVATVSTDGLVTATDFGAAEIEVEVASTLARALGADLRAAVGGTPAPAKRAIRLRSRPKAVRITPANDRVDVGETKPFKVEIIDKHDKVVPNPGGITWMSQDPSVATIDGNGNAKGVRRGKTTIFVLIPFSPGTTPELYQAQTSLRVTVCGGIDEVTTWHADVAVSYEHSRTLSGLEFDVSQVSSARAVLVGPATTQDEKVMVWKGTAIGTANLFNRIRTRSTGGRVTDLLYESANGQSGGDTRLEVLIPNCTYQLHYRDRVDVKKTNAQTLETETVPGANLGITTWEAKPVGQAPEGGSPRNEFKGDEMPLARVWPIGSDYWNSKSILDNLFGAYYAETGIATSMFLAIGKGDPDWALGQAKARYTLTQCLSGQCPVQ